MFSRCFSFSNLVISSRRFLKNNFRINQIVTNHTFLKLVKLKEKRTTKIRSNTSIVSVIPTHLQNILHYKYATKQPNEQNKLVAISLYKLKRNV